MPTGLRVSRAIQLLGALLAIWGIVDYSGRGDSWAACFALALILIIGARVYAWMTVK